MSLLLKHLLLLLLLLRVLLAAAVSYSSFDFELKPTLCKPLGLQISTPRGHDFDTTA